MTNVVAIKLPNSIDILVERLISSSLNDVYSTWTKPSEFGSWLASGKDTILSVKSEWFEGGEYCVVGLCHDGQIYCLRGVFVELTKSRRLSFSWEYNGPIQALQQNKSLVTVDFRYVSDDVTKIIISHKKQRTQEAAGINIDRWWSSVDKFKTVVSGHQRA